MFRQELEKKPEQPFMMYIAFDDLQVLIHQLGFMLLHHILYEYCRGHCKWRRSGGISTLSR